MNKISKKIVSLVTMAAFALTLVPAAAFAATEDTTYTVSEATAADFNKTTVTITLDDEDYAELQKNAGQNVLVWAEKADGTVVDYTGTYSNQQNIGAPSEWLDTAGKSNEVAILSNPTSQTVKVDLTLARGDYKIFVAVNDGIPEFYKDRAAAKAEAVVDGGVAFHSYGPAMANASNYTAVQNGAYTNEPSVAVDTDLTTVFKINDSETDMTVGTLKNVIVWITDTETDELTKVAKVTQENKTLATVSENAYKITEAVDNDYELKVQFSKPGKYIIQAGNGADLAAAQANPIPGKITVDVKDDTVVDSMTLTAGWVDYENNQAKPEDALNAPEFRFDKEAQTYVLDLTQVDGFNFNGVDQVVLRGIAYDKDGEKAKHQTINFSASEPNTVVKLNPTTDNTEYNGAFETAFTMESQKNTVITITEPESGVSYDVLVIAQKTSATDIDATKNGGYVLATTDDQWTAGVNGNFGSAVQFMVTDEKGDAVEGLTTKDFVLNVEDKANKSSLANSNLEVVELGDGLYTLGVREADVQADNKLLTEGKYEVRVALAGVDSENDNIGVTFTAAEFDKIEDVELNITDKKTGVELDDQITLDTEATVSLVYVDGNGVKIAGPTTFSWNATNSALAVQSATGTTLVMKPDTIEHQGVIGSTVTVQAAVPSYGLVTKELTIVSSYNTYSLELDPAEGPVNEYNKVDLNVLNSDGDVAKNINGDINVVVADSSNEDAKVSVKQANDVTKGEGALTIYASQETELELVVTVEEGNKIVAADTLTYTVGAADPLAGRTVVMTIDSTEYVVNNNIITGDAAPYVDSNWRTMVPIRALAEAFDAEVYWNQDDSTVTINFDAGTEIVMTVGEDTYTVNGAEATMDTEPVNAGDRVYVPIRFAAEGLGFSVTPLYNADGLTASVVFQR